MFGLATELKQFFSNPPSLIADAFPINMCLDEGFKPVSLRQSVTSIKRLSYFRPLTNLEPIDWLGS